MIRVRPVESSGPPNPFLGGYARRLSGSLLHRKCGSLDVWRMLTMKWDVKSDLLRRYR